MKIQCTHCLDVIESLYGHDFKYCSCGTIFIDGGMEYYRIGFNKKTDFAFLYGTPDDWLERPEDIDDD